MENDSSSMIKPETLSTASSSPSEKIHLRPMTLSDVDDFMVWATDSDVTRFCTWEPYTSREAAIAYLNDVVLPHPWLRAICLDNDRPIGSISVTPVDKIRGEIGYVLGSKYWGKGIATEAVRLVAAEIFKENPEMERLEALVDVDNVGSQKVLEKVGFVREGVMRKFMYLKGNVRDMVMFSFLPSDSLH
ncbi:Acyl-CoA N-acyltransferase [Arabidopsis suecica]|uniref:Acyl-CoA N-acyltransferase n=1 Tax=Arabidopsis suecica TaxID=45249 RepID=A0A8T2AIC9_ARASU|nr:Acyl-CoA N-acyltransferase [Arabidopsis suecica]